MEESEQKDKTVFERIIDGELPSEKVFENERLIAIKDIAPVAPVHLLIITKQAYPSLQAVPKEDLTIMQEVIDVAQSLAVKHGVENGYRLISNIGPNSGQEVPHLHFHLIGGRRLGPLA
jgi:histidine triad (HIT) family protein